MSAYIYNPLKDTRTVRFVRLLPGTAGGVQCQIFRASLDARTKYIALSYAWGPTRMSHTIICDGRHLQVTESLMSALRRLRLPDEPRVFWVDAICINQDDIEERNRSVGIGSDIDTNGKMLIVNISQVSLMCEIYQRASQLFIWLGPGDSYSTAGVNVMWKFASAQEELMTIGRLPYIHTKPGEWIAFSKLLQRPWFERIWVIQELAMGLELSGESAPILLCGVHQFDLGTLRAACDWCNQLILDSKDGQLPEGDIMRDIQSGVRRFLVLCDMTKQANPEEVRKGLWRHWLLSKLAATREKKATDPRDRLFALYGFLRDGDRPVVVADYSKSTAAVFQEFAHSYITKGRCLDILSEVEEPGLRTLRSVPSWVPNWGIETSRIPLLRQTETLGTRQPFEFARQPCGALQPSIHSMRDDVILVDGICFDEVTWVSDMLSTEQLTHSTESPSILIELWRDKGRLLDTYPNKRPAIEAFYKTLICGREEDDRQKENFVTYWKSLHCGDETDMATFCINSPEMVQLLCLRSAGAEIVAQMHDAQVALEKLQMDDAHGGATNGETLFTNLEMQNTLLHTDALKGGVAQFFRNANQQRYSDLLRETAHRRVFFTTQRGYMGMGIEGTQPGDIVTILTGGKIPYILRKTALCDRRFAHKAPKSPYSSSKAQTLVGSLVGEAYVHGIMRGEAVEKEWEIQWDRIAIM